MEAQTQKPLMSVGEVADLLEISERSVYNLETAGKMPPKIKLGGLVRWRRAAIMEWIEQGCPAVEQVA